MAATAQAATPTLLSVGQQDRHPTARFSAAAADDVTVYMATKPDRATDGAFYSENVADLDLLTAGEIASGVWLGSSQLEPGTYWVMLDASTYRPECYEGADCVNGYSNVLSLTVPADPVVPSPPPIPTALDSCFDHIDNDGDGKVDLDDIDNSPSDTNLCDQVKPKPSKSVRLICNTWTSGKHRAIPRRAPRKCSIWRKNWAHFQSVSWIKGRWSRWGKSTAYATVTGVYSMGARWKMRVRAYRPRRNCEGNLVYTRVKTKNVNGGKRWYVTKPDTCPH